MLEFLDAFARDPDEELIVIVKPGGDNSMASCFLICKGDWRMERFGDVLKLLTVGIVGDLGIHFLLKYGEGWRWGNDSVREGGTSDGG